MFQDFARKPVPDNKTTTGWMIGLIYIGVGLAAVAVAVYFYRVDLDRIYPVTG